MDLIFLAVSFHPSIFPKHWLALHRKPYRYDQKYLGQNVKVKFHSKKNKQFWTTSQRKKNILGEKITPRERSGLFTPELS